MNIVSYFGIHWAQGIAFLEQQKPRKVKHDRFESTGTNALGLAVKSPFFVKPLGARLRCPHLIPHTAIRPDVDQWNEFKALYQRSPLVRAMAPYSPGITYFHESTVPRLVPQILTQMCSPTVPVITSPLWLSFDKIVQQMTITNLQPFVLIGMAATNTLMINNIVNALSDLPRPLVMIGQSDVILPRGVTEYRDSGLTDDDVEAMIQLPWQTIGAAIVRHAMKKEQFA